MQRRLSFLAAAGLVALLALSACGGSDDGASATATSPLATPTDAGPPPTPAPTPEAAFESFRYEVDFSAEVEDASGLTLFAFARLTEGVFEAPASHSFSGVLGAPGQPPHAAVLIDDEAWYREDVGGWRALTLSDVEALGVTALTSAHTGFLNDASFEAMIGDLPSTEELVQGRAARRYDLSLEDIDRVRGLLRLAFFQDISEVDTFALDVWIDDATGAMLEAELTASAPATALLGAELPEGIPPAARVTATLTLALSQVDDESIRISPPI